MFKNYFKIAVRNLIKRKTFSVINIVGLVVGMAACLLILQYVSFERSYDTFHENGDNLYRIRLDRYDKGVLSTQWVAGCAAVGYALRENFPEVLEYARLRDAAGVVSNQDVKFREERAYLATASFLTMFSYPLERGDAATALEKPFTAVLTASTAKKYFGSEDPIGKTILLDGDIEAEITGIAKDLRENTHLKFDILFSWASFVELRGSDVNTEWMWDGFYTYVLMQPGTDPTAFEAKLPVFIQEQTGDELREYNHNMVFYLQPVRDIHLYSDLMYEFEPGGDGQIVYFLLIISVFIIAIAWINYINLSTARSIDRSKEVGVRKVMGSTRAQLLKQFIFESILINVVALIVALLIIVIALPSFSQITGKTITLSLFGEPVFWSVLAVLFSVGAFLSGLYPAILLSSFAPAVILRGKAASTLKGVSLRKVLVVLQFAASVALLVATFTVFRQISFMRAQDLGMNIEQTLVLRGPSVTDSTYSEKLNVFRTDLLNYPAIQQITTSTVVPGGESGWNAGGIRLESESENQSKQYRVIGIDYAYLETFDIDLLAGRNFSEEFGKDPATVLFNESAVRHLGFENNEEVLGEKLFFWDDVYEIIGVIDDFHHESLREAVDPLIFRLLPNSTDFYSLKIGTENVSETIRTIENRWNEIYPGNPFDYFFLDDHFDLQYRADLRFGEVFGIFAMLAIFVACLGLIGLASFTTAQRTKEIGIRKVMGASVPGIISLLTKGFAGLVLISFVIAVPVVYVAMNAWLSNFAFRVNLDWRLYLLPALIVMLIALLSVSSQTLKAAVANPARSLQYE